MLEKRKVIDQIEITSNGIIFLKEQNQILENGVVISSIPHRTPFEPDMDSALLPDEVKPYAQLKWTPTVVNEYKQKKKDLESKR